MRKKPPASMPHTIRMHYGKLIGWGIVIYAVAFLTWSLLIAYGLFEGVLPRLISLAVLVVVAAAAGRSLHFSSWKDILPYSFLWAVMIAALDGIMAVPYAGWKIYSELGVWTGYIIVVVIPLFFAEEVLAANDRLRRWLT